MPSVGSSRLCLSCWVRMRTGAGSVGAKKTASNKRAKLKIFMMQRLIFIPAVRYCLFCTPFSWLSHVRRPPFIAHVACSVENKKNMVMPIIHRQRAPNSLSLKSLVLGLPTRPQSLSPAVNESSHRWCNQNSKPSSVLHIQSITKMQRLHLNAGSQVPIGKVWTIIHTHGHLRKMPGKTSYCIAPYKRLLF